MKEAKFTLNARELTKTLAPLFRTINRSSVLPILECVTVQQKEKEISFGASDLENVVEYRVETDGFILEPFCLNAITLKNILKNSISGTIEISISADKKATIKDGDFILSTQVEDFGGFPKDKAIEFTKTFSLDAAIFNSELSKAKRFVSNDDLRPALTGVYLQKKEGKLEIAGTDAYRLYWHSFADAPDGIQSLNAILPSKCTTLAIDMFKEGIIDVCVADRYIEFKQKGKRLTSRLIDVVFPNYDAVINRWESSFNFKRKDINAFLKLALLFSFSSTTKVGLRIKGDVVEFEAESYNETATYKLPIYNSTNPSLDLHIAVNIRILLDILKVNAKDEYVKMEMEAANKSIVIDDCCLLMPMIIHKEI